ANRMGLPPGVPCGINASEGARAGSIRRLAPLTGERWWVRAAFPRLDSIAPREMPLDPCTSTTSPGPGNPEASDPRIVDFRALDFRNHEFGAHAFRVHEFWARAPGHLNPRDSNPPRT